MAAPVGHGAAQGSGHQQPASPGTQRAQMRNDIYNMEAFYPGIQTDEIKALSGLLIRALDNPGSAASTLIKPKKNLTVRFEFLEGLPKMVDAYVRGNVSNLPQGAKSPLSWTGNTPLTYVDLHYRELKMDGLPSTAAVEFKACIPKVGARDGIVYQNGENVKIALDGLVADVHHTVTPQFPV